MIRAALVAVGLTLALPAAAGDPVASWQLGGAYTRHNGHFCTVRGPVNAKDGIQVDFALRYWGGLLGRGAMGARVEEPHGPYILENIQIDGRTYTPEGPVRHFSASDAKAMVARLKVARRFTLVTTHGITRQRFESAYLTGDFAALAARCESKLPK